MLDRRARSIFALGLLWAAALCGSASGQPQTSAAAAPQSTAQQEDLHFTSERWDRIGDMIIADGKVEVHYKGIALFADHMEIDTKSKDVLALGSVSLHSPKQPPALTPPADGATTAVAISPVSAVPVGSSEDEVFSGERLEFNLDTALGRMEKAFGLVEPSMFVTAETLDKKPGIYAMERMTFTTCAQPNPRWKFSCARANLKKGDYIEMWGVTFSIKGVPVFYWPYMRYPLDRERSTGFLSPETGFSGVKGYYLSQSFYLAAARNIDATFQLDYYSRQGVGGGAEARYLFNGGTKGTLNVFYFLFKTQTDSSGAALPTPKNAYLFRWNHTQTLPGGFSLTAAVDMQSSYNFLRQFDTNFNRATVSNRSSQVYLTKTWSVLSLSVRVAQFETILPGSNGKEENSIIYRNLPQVNFTSFKLKVLGPIYFSFGGGYNAIEYGYRTDFDAGKELKTQTFNIVPQLSAPWAPFPWLSLTAAVKENVNYFWQRYEPGAGVVDKPLFVTNYGLNFSLTGPSIQKIYDFESGTRIKHLIEPTAAYSYESPIENFSQIVTPYGFFRSHQLSFGLNNHIYIKEPGMLTPREVFTWGVQEVYYLAPDQGPLKYYRVNGLAPQWSEISSYLRFFPTTGYSLDLTAGYNPYYKMISSLRLGATIGQPKDDYFLSINWVKSVNAWLEGAAAVANPGVPVQYSSVWDRHQIGVSGGLKIPALQVETRGEISYNFIDRRLLYARADFVYHYQCLDLKAEFRIFNYLAKPDVSFNFSIALGNIGDSSSVLK